MNFMTTKLFFDTYALIEILEQNPKFQKYLETQVVITNLNLFELYFYGLRTTTSKQAHKWLVDFSQFTVVFDKWEIANGASLKMKNKQCSMADCIGYATAQRLGIPFLTGDKAFEKLPGVEFVR